VDHVLERESKAAIGPMALWDELCSQIRVFNPDYVVLVARKMPRLFDAIEFNLGAAAICISDQAIPFVQKELKGARVAIVDDLWNVGTTMRHAEARVRRAGPSAVRMFALGAKDAANATANGVRLAEPATMTEERYEHLVSSVPNLLRLVPKPFDADFPIAHCAIRAPYTSWVQCWAWLRGAFGSAVHTTLAEEQREYPLARATVNLSSDDGWVVKVRLYFDFASGSCNLVPMALAPSQPLRDVYPDRSLAKKVFAAASLALGNAQPLLEEDRREAFGRLGAFCDSLVFLGESVRALSGLVERDSLEPFSIEDFGMQFGPAAARELGLVAFEDVQDPGREKRVDFLRSRQIPSRQPLLEEKLVVEAAARKAEEGWPAELVFDALFQSLATASGADDPTTYALQWPYSVDEIRAEPYLRLRIGFTYAELTEFLRAHLRTNRTSSTPEAVASALIDLFVDLGAIVPTITLKGEPCLRVYRKGESNPRWDTDLARLALALHELRSGNEQPSRTRVTKIAAIIAMSSAGKDTGFRAAAAERGTVAMMGKSVVERSDIEITAYMRNLGLWDKLVADDNE
jgi:hypothetical protein